jgi:hypothetical protein
MPPNAKNRILRVYNPTELGSSVLNIGEGKAKNMLVVAAIPSNIGIVLT